MVERPAAAQRAGAAPARARVGAGHLEAEVAARHLQVRRLLDEVAVEEVDTLDERAPHREDGAVEEAHLDDAVGDRGLGRVLGVARLEANGATWSLSSSGRPAGTSTWWRPGESVDVGELPRRVPVDRGGERGALHGQRDPRGPADGEADRVAAAAEPAVERVADHADLDDRGQEVDDRADRDREPGGRQVGAGRGDAADAQARVVVPRRQREAGGDGERRRPGPGSRRAPAGRPSPRGPRIARRSGRGASGTPAAGSRGRRWTSGSRGRPESGRPGRARTA